MIASALLALVLFGTEPARACGVMPGGDWMRAQFAEHDLTSVEAAQSIFVATLVATERDGEIFVVAPTETVVGEMPTGHVRSPHREWWSCGYLPVFYVDWNPGPSNGELVIVLTSGRVGSVNQIAALDTAEGQRLLELARERRLRLNVGVTQE